MTYYGLVPVDTTDTTTTVWVGVVPGTGSSSPQASTWIENRTTGRRWDLAQWRRWTSADGIKQIAFQRVTLDQLHPATLYLLDLVVNGRVVTSASSTTLPSVMPAIDQPPLVVLLGSCFSHRRDQSGRVGRAFLRVPAGAKPSVKLLCGDQVYLDSPWYRYVLPQSPAALQATFFEHYVSTWFQRADWLGFYHLLRLGANYFASDDHEYWNNAPLPAAFAVNTWTEAGRKEWRAAARSLYAAFQTEQTVKQFAVGSLRFFLADTRINRQPDRSTFLAPTDMAALREWVRSLNAPGVLVLGQPIFADRAGWRGNLADWNLPDFRQYAELCRTLVTTRQPVLVLTGDVHYGRVAAATTASGAELVEIISSPLALVEPSVGGRWRPAPRRFPAWPIPGVPSVPVITQQDWRRFANHFLTFELHGLADGMRVKVRTWETEPDDGRPSSRVVYQHDFKRRAA